MPERHGKHAHHAPEPEGKAPRGTQPAAQGGVEESGQQAGGEAQRSSGWGRLFRAGKPRLTRGNAIAAVLALGLGFAVATQAHQTQQGGLEALSEPELVSLLDDSTKRLDALGTERRELEESRDELTQGSDADAERAAEGRLRSYEVLAGTRAASGTGISMQVSDPQGTLTADVMLNAVQEMRDAGAEAIQIDDERVVANTWFSMNDAGAVAISGKPVSPPYTIVALGDSHTLSGGMRIPGGFVEVVRSLGGEVEITESDDLRVDALQQVQEPRYARPVAPTPGG